MLESLIFMILSFIGIIGLIISIIILLVGWVKKSRKLKSIGFGIGIVPIFCFGLISFWFMIVIPSFNDSEMNDFSGIYHPNISSKKILIENKLFKKSNRLILKENGTFTFDSITGINLTKTGKWKTGGIDGHFIFMDNNENELDYVYRSGSGENCKLSFNFTSKNDDFFNRERIFFVKTND